MIHFGKITDIFCIIDESSQEFESKMASCLIGNKPKRTPKMSKSEVMTIVVLFHLSGFRTFKHFYKYYVVKHMSDEFPQTVSYNRFVELMQSCVLMPLFF